MLAPLDPEKYPFGPCRSPRCENAAKFYFVFELRPNAEWTGEPIRIVLKLGVCEPCSVLSTNPEKYLTDKMWSVVLAAFDQLNRPRPHRSSTTLSIVGIDDEKRAAYFAEFFPEQ